MEAQQGDRMAGVLGWLLVAVPSALGLAALALISVYRFGVSSGLAFITALVVWVGMLVWRALRK